MGNYRSLFFGVSMAKIKRTKRFYGANRELMTFSFDPWFIKKLKSFPAAKSNRSAFVQELMVEALGWKKPPQLKAR